MSLSARLREERQRLGLSQQKLATVAGVAKNTAINWEKGVSSPTADALALLAEAGADAVYILTGRRLAPVPVEEEYIRGELDELERELIDPGRHRLPNEDEAQADARISQRARINLDGYLAHDARALPADLIERMKALREAVDNPQRRSLLRAADFAQAHRQRAEKKELLAIWLEPWPYSPDHAVMEIMARIALNYSVPEQALVELANAIYNDIEEQRSADRIIAAQDGGAA